MVGIIIPTKNRSSFIKRTLQYYASVHCRHTVYICDSSDRKHADSILKHIEKLNGLLNVIYNHYPDTGAAWAIRAGANCVQEPYAVVSGDDDLLVPDSLSMCEKFLADNPDYSSAHGNSIMVSVVEKAYTTDVLATWEYFLGDNELESAADRLEKYLKNYWVVQFSLQRTPAFQEAMDNIELLTDPSFTEILCNCVSVTHGKSKKIDVLYLIRQVHSQRGILKSGAEWVLSPEFQMSLKVFRQTLSHHLSQRDRIEAQYALGLVNGYFLSYLENSFRKTYTHPTRKRIMLNALKKLSGPIKPFLKLMYYRIRGLLPGVSSAYYLPILLRSGSKFNKDFLPVYRSITGKKAINNG